MSKIEEKNSEYTPYRQAQEVQYQKQLKRFDIISQVGNLPWSILGLGIGIALYFNLPFEGSFSTTALILFITTVIWFLSERQKTVHSILTVILIIVVGYAAALLRTHSSQTPLLAERYKTYPFKMRVEAISPLKRNQLRYSGTVLKLGKLKQEQTPIKIQIRTTDQGPAYQYGDIICGLAKLARPKGPHYPGGYDYGWTKWFEKIGATGFAISAIKLCQTSMPLKTSPFTKLIADTRSFISNRLSQNLSQSSNALAQAILLGERGRILEEDLIAMRRAGLGHLLAISGLHMAVFAGTLFFTIRALLAFFPTIVERYPIKKWAAIMALGGGTAYFIISGQSIPTQRAFLMMAIIFLAILVERPALTMRNVVLAAIIILLVRPESLFSPGFQMSFAAVAALIALYEWNSNNKFISTLKNKYRYHVLSKPVFFLIGIWMTSLVATLATAPFAIYHFHQVSYMGPIGNMLAIPIFTFLIMPFAVLSLALMPFGLEPIALKILTLAIEMLLATAHWTASFDPSVILVGQIEPRAIIVFTLGTLIWFFTQSPIRYTAFACLLLSVLTAKQKERPDILINEQGTLIALRATDQKLYAPDGRKAAFTLDKWLLADGDERSGSDSRTAPNINCDHEAYTGIVKGINVSLIKSISALEEECKRAKILIYKRAIKRFCNKPRFILTQTELKKSGTIAIYIRDGKLEIKRSYKARSNRLWGRGVKRKTKQNK